MIEGWRNATGRCFLSPIVIPCCRKALYDLAHFLCGRGRMAVVDFFAGCGGFSLGAHQAGFEVSAAFDIDPVLTFSYSRNFPNTKLHRLDLSVAKGDEIRRLAGASIDGIIGGPPCQGFSSIGLRSPLDERRSLLFHYFRLVAELRPLFFVMENVRGLMEPRNEMLLDAALALVTDAYHLTGPLVLDAADFGAATRRRRVVVVGILKGSARPISEAALTRSDMSSATVKAAIADLRQPRSLPSVEGYDRWKISGAGRPSVYAQRLRSADGTFTGNLRTQHTCDVLERFSAIPAGGFDEVGRYPRLSWCGLCPTLRAGTGSERGSFQSVRPIHPEADRV